MKTIFLSFTPEPFYEPITKGVKRYEYRSRFCNEECYAYLYLSAPVQKVVARIKFGKRIEFESWEKEFSDDEEAMKRLKEFKTEGKRYAIPILEFQEIAPVTLKRIKEQFTDFRPPRSYYILDNNPLLLEYLDSMQLLGNKLINDLTCIEAAEVCTY